tara:strand:- start:772 stop:1185 length:414 start_codon:yes stop_codon:yes gene_type:complete
MTENKLRIFEYTEKHYPDQYLKIKITLDQENYDHWKLIFNSGALEEFKEYETKYKGKLMSDLFADPLPEKIDDLEEEKIIPMLHVVKSDDVYNLGEFEENNEFDYSGDAPENYGFREITDGLISEIEWFDDVISNNR